MSEAAPPVGYHVVTDGDGVWPTNITDDSTQYKTGAASVKFTGNPTGTYLYLQSTVAVPCAPGDLLRVSGWARSAEKTGDDIATLSINWYTAAGVYDSQSVVHNAELTAATTWQYVTAIVTAPSTAYGWRVNFGKPTSAEDIWWDSVFVEAVEPAFFAVLASDQSCSDAETVIFDDDSTLGYDYSASYDNTNGKFTAPSAGLYSFSCLVVGLDVDAGEYWQVAFYKNNSFYSTAGLQYSPAANTDMYVGGTLGPVLLAAGDTIEVKVASDHSGDIVADGYNLNPVSWFAGAKIR